MGGSFIISGPIVHSLAWDSITILEQGFVAVDKGKIVACDTKDNLVAVQRQLNIPDAQVRHLLDGQFLMPGMIDTHIHAPQYPNAGLGLDKPLLEWLEAYTFPLEQQYADSELAREVYSAVVKRTLGNGTTTACYFATIHAESSLVLADVCSTWGQRALIGKVNMNRNHPDYYGETSEDSLKNTKSFVDKIIEMNNPLIRPIITPRFAINCDMPLMKQLAEFAAKYDLHIQTHISENKTEVEMVTDMYPHCKNYVDVYDRANLLTKKTVLAHGVYLDDEELKVLAERGSSISHCPNSNTSLKSGNCKVRRLLAAGVTVGLGTDISGGYSPSMMDAMRACIDVSINVGFQDESQEALNYNHAFYLATLGGAKALAMDDQIGNFKIGKDFDALIITTKSPGSQIDILPVRDYSTLELVQKFIYGGDDRNVTQVFVAGKMVKNVAWFTENFLKNMDLSGGHSMQDVGRPTLLSQ